MLSAVTEAALRYAQNGLSVIPVRSNKFPIGSWRHAHTSPLTEEQVRHAFASPEVAGVAIAPGLVSGNLVIVDFDGDDWAYLYNQFIDRFPQAAQSRQVRSARGRRHVWLYFPDTTGIDYLGFKFNPAIDAGVELKANSGYVIAPPSSFRREDGTTSTYTWVDPAASIVTIDDHVEMIKWMRRTWLRGRLPDRAKCFFDSGALPGEQNQEMTYVAQQMRDAKYTRDEIVDSLWRGIRKCDQDPSNPWTERDVEAIVDSTVRTGVRQPLTPDRETLNDRGNAELFVTLHKNEVKYVPEWGRWLAWTGSYWDKRTGDWAVADWSDDVADERIRQSELATELTGDPRAGKPFYVEAKGLKNRHSVSGMHWALALHPNVRARSEVFDNRPWLLNVANGTLDLKTGVLRPANREDMLTVQVPVEYHEDAKCPRWQSFLSELFPDDPDMPGFLQRAVGYSLTGDTSEQCFFYLHGSGANGKSTFLNVLEALLGEMATWTGFGTFLSHMSEGVRNDLADLVGRRVVIASEPPVGARMDESLVKQLTGADQVKARFLFHEFFSYKPQYKIWLAANHRVEVRDSSEAYWRRIRVLHFKQNFIGREDPLLVEKLMGELEGILTWAVEGAKQWQVDGLQTPESVKLSTTDYRTDSDLIGRFVEDEYIRDPQSEELASSVYAVYRQWATTNGEEVLSSNLFGRRLREKGFDKRVVSRDGITALRYIGIVRKPERQQIKVVPLNGSGTKAGGLENVR